MTNFGAFRSVGPGGGRLTYYLGPQAQIWRYDPQIATWQQIFVFPLVSLPNDTKALREAGYRRTVVFQGASDLAPALYASTISPLGSLILRSQDGEHFVPVSQPGLGNPNTTWSFRALVPFNGRLYAAPAGRIRGERIERNTAEAAIVFENADPVAAPWRPVNEIGFGDSTNRAIFEMSSLNGFLYAGTFNPYKGFQIWKTRAQGYPYRWKKVIADGAFWGNANEAAVSMCVFGDALYVGTGKQRLRSAAELIRIDPDDRWELVVGEPRRTFEGLKLPLSGLGPGFDHGYNGAIWEMTEHDSWLYAGTESKISILAFLRPFLTAARAHRWNEVIDDLLEAEGGFDLWRSRDGTIWDVVTNVGFGNPNNFGIESMASTPAGLFIGTMAVPHVITGRGVPGMTAGFQGGCEIWLGR
jgi:hypothetical protein